MSYRVVDEPTPSGLERWAVRPFWPLLAQMLAGSWLAWPWFLLNSRAMGSATEREERRWVVVAAIGSVVVSAIIVAMLGPEAESSLWRYVLLAMTVLKLGAAYWVHRLQERTFGLFEHFGHPARNGLVVVLLGAAMRGVLLREVPLFVALVLS